MSTPDTETRAAVLLLFNGTDAALLEFADGLRQRGADVHPVSEAYAAMAMLASGLPVQHLVADIRQLDEDEMQLLALAPRYFPGLRILVPLLEGTIARQHGKSGRAAVLPPADLIESILGIPFAVTADGLDEEDASDDTPVWYGEPIVENDEHCETPLSTDGGPDTGTEGPALHETVRQRMGEGVVGPIRRRPPGSHTVPVEPVAPASPDAERGEPSTNPGALSPDEIDALLGESGDGPARNRDSDAGDAA